MKMDIKLPDGFEIIVTYLVILLATVSHDRHVNAAGEDHKLVLMQTVYRHGDRAQIQRYKNDNHTEADWSVGFGQLTQRGMRQEYRLGQLFKRRYIDTGFLSSSYNHTQIRVRSTDVDRTLMSAETFLAGMYPPNNTQVWNKDLSWQPIPVHTVALHEDYVYMFSLKFECAKQECLHRLTDKGLTNNNTIKPDPPLKLLHLDFPCPNYDKEIQRVRQLPVYKNFVASHQDVFNELSKYSGEPATFNGIAKILDPLYCQKMHNMSIPDWALSRWSSILELRDAHASFGYYTDEAGRLLGGFLLDTFITNMQKMRNGTFKPPRAFIYSAHDTTVLAALAALTVYNHLMVPYSAALILELYKSSGGYHVKLLYRNVTDSHDTITLKLADCDELCPLEKFESILKHQRVTDPVKSCGTPQHSAKSYNASLIAAVVLGCLVVLLSLPIVIIVYRNYKAKKRRGMDYTLVNTIDEDLE